jgi:hypothetical protein
MKDYLREFEEHLDNITKDVLDEAREASPVQKKLAAYGRILMDQAVTTKDDELSNVMASVGDALTRFGTSFGPNSLEDLVKKTGTTPNVIKKLLAFAEKIYQTHGDLKSDNDDGGLDDEGDDEFTSAADDEMDAIAADRAARARRG